MTTHLLNAVVENILANDLQFAELSNEAQVAHHLTSSCLPSLLLLDCELSAIFNAVGRVFVVLTPLKLFLQ